MSDHLSEAYPRLARRLAKTPLAELPTPVSHGHVQTRHGPRLIAVKRDDQSADLYGGNKVRKLEYILQRAAERRAHRVATFGTVASNHALATAMYARRCGFACTCLLSHQTKTANAPIVLNMHLRNGTEIVAYRGDRGNRIAINRHYLQGRHTWVIPAGGSSWLGVVGFVNAALELADQIKKHVVEQPDRLYVANGTMATAAGLALGLALAGLSTEVQAVRVTHEHVANRTAMRRLLVKTATLLNRLDDSVPADTADRVRLRFRDEFFGGGYARPTRAALHAIDIAHDELGLKLEATYTGKAMAALLHDLKDPAFADQSILFWNTYNSRPLPAGAERPTDTSALPAEFLRYFD